MNSRPRSVLLIATSGAVLAAASLAACTAASAPHAATGGQSQAGHVTVRQVNPDPRTTAALLRIAQRFNTDYDSNDDGPVYDRWDARSQAVISRAEYIRRHEECATAPRLPVHVEDAMPSANGAWLVHYEIGGQQLTDYWFYTSHRWVFDLLLSNPDAARFYRLDFAQYARATGCNVR